MTKADYSENIINFNGILLHNENNNKQEKEVKTIPNKLIRQTHSQKTNIKY